MHTFSVFYETGYFLKGGGAKRITLLKFKTVIKYLRIVVECCFFACEL